jgi:putative transposase
VTTFAPGGTGQDAIIWRAVRRPPGRTLARAPSTVWVAAGRLTGLTVADPEARRASDLVQRRFARAAPDRLRVADITYVSTWSGTVYVGFVVHAYPQRIIGWRSGTSMRAQLVLDAVEQAV